MAQPTTWTAERARVASLSRSRTADDPALLAARQALKAAHLEDYVGRVLAEAPPLTDQQRDRIVVLLRSPANATQPALAASA